MLEKLKEDVYNANLELKERELIVYTWGNVSGINRDKNLVVIKPSGVPYQKLTSEKMVVVDLEGEVVEGDLKPSSDTATHLQLYRDFTEIGGVVHTHSPWATIWAQAEKEIPCLGTTHADHFYGSVPCTRILTETEIKNQYELNTGKVIVETFAEQNYRYTPGVLVANHGPFTWGDNPKKAVKNSVILEEIAKMAYRTLQLNKSHQGIPVGLLNKHFYRKHGDSAYYGQK